MRGFLLPSRGHVTLIAGVAQEAGQLICNQQAVGSIPAAVIAAQNLLGIFLFRQMPFDDLALLLSRQFSQHRINLLSKNIKQPFFFRYFGIHTTWYLHSHLVCDRLDFSSIGKLNFGHFAQFPKLSLPFFFVLNNLFFFDLTLLRPNARRLRLHR